MKKKDAIKRLQEAEDLLEAMRDYLRNQDRYFPARRVLLHGQILEHLADRVCYQCGKLPEILIDRNGNKYPWCFKCDMRPYKFYSQPDTGPIVV